MGRNLKRTKGRDGTALPGLWEGENVRMEMDQGYWQFQVPTREVGQTGYYEFRPISMGGKWRTVGWRKTLDGCIAASERMMSGEMLLRPATGRGDDRIEAHLVPWSEVAAEIAVHPSVRGDTPATAGAHC